MEGVSGVVGRQAAEWSHTTAGLPYCNLNEHRCQRLQRRLRQQRLLPTDFDGQCVRSGLLQKIKSRTALSGSAHTHTRTSSTAMHCSQTHFILVAVRSCVLPGLRSLWQRTCRGMRMKASCSGEHHAKCSSLKIHDHLEQRQHKNSGVLWKQALTEAKGQPRLRDSTHRTDK